MIKKIIVLAIMLVMAFSFTACDDKKTPQERIERLCGIKLPKEMEVEYNFFDQAFHGDFTLFTVFILKAEPTEFLNDNSFSSHTGKTSFDYILRGNDVPTEQYINWESEYLTASLAPRGSAGVALFFPETLKLIFAIGVN